MSILVSLLVLLPAGSVSAQTAVPTCPIPYTAYGCYVSTPYAYLTLTAAAPTPSIAPSSTLRALDELFPTATPFTPSSECPAGTFEQDNLDPVWSLACRHCLDLEATPTPPYPVSTANEPTFETPVLTLPDFETWTPTPDASYTATFTPSPTLTPTATPTPVCPPLPDNQGGILYFYEGFEGLCPSGLPFYNESGSSTTTMPRNGLRSHEAAAGVDNWWQWEVDPSWHIYGVGVWGRRTTSSGASVLGVQYYNAAGGLMFNNVRPGGLGDGTDWVFWGSTPWGGGGATGVRWIQVYANAVGSASFMDDMNVAYYDVTGYETPVPTWSPTPTETPILTGSETPTPTYGDVGQLILADCENPVYVNEEEPGEPAEPPISLGWYIEEGQCQTWIPFIDQQLGDQQIKVPQVDLCPVFYNFILTIAGLEINVGDWIMLGLVIMLIRWALFN